MGLSRDGQRAAFGFDDGAVQVWDLYTHTKIKSFSVSHPPARRVAISRDGLWTVAADDAPSLHAWRLEGTGSSWSLAQSAKIIDLAFPRGD